MAGNTTQYTPSETLRRVVGLHRKRLYALMKDGTLSYEYTQGKRLLDGAELARVFGSNFAPHGTKETASRDTETHHDTGRNAPEILALQQEMALLREQHRVYEALLQEKERLIDHLRRERDDWCEQAKAHTRLLTTRQAQETPSLWARLFGTRP